MDAHQEQRIAHGLRAGDVAAWHALYDAFSERVWRLVAQRLGPSRSETADVVQEIFLEAARSASGYDPERGGLWPWLQGLARRQVAGYFRKKRRRDRATRPDASDQRNVVTLIRYLDGEGQAPTDPLDTAETAAMVRDALGKLTRDDQDLLTGKYIDGLTAEQLAAETDRTVEAVRSKLARARRAFKRSLRAISGEDMTTATS